MEIPPPEERLCKKHQISIKPSSWRSGHRTTGCWKCTEEQGGTESRYERNLRYRTSARGKEKFKYWNKKYNDSHHGKLMRHLYKISFECRLLDTLRRQGC